MLSISDIKKHSFAYQKGGRFYESVEVDSFFSNVIETLDTLTAAYEKSKRDNDELIRKISVLSEKVEEYRRDEDNIRSALLIAQRAGESVLNDAKAEAENLVLSAKEQAASVITSADDYAKDKSGEIDDYHSRIKADYESRMKEAEKKADSIIDEARKKGDEIVAKAKADTDAFAEFSDNKLAIAQGKILSMKKIVSDFKTSVIDVMNQQIKLLESIDVDEIDLSELELDEIDEVYHPEYTSEDYNSDKQTEDETDDEDKATVDGFIETSAIEEIIIDDDEPIVKSEIKEEIEDVEEISLDLEDDNAGDAFNGINADDDTGDSDENDEYNGSTEEPEYDEDDEEDYYTDMMERALSERATERKEKRNVFTQLVESDEQLYRRNEEPSEEPAEQKEHREELKFGKDYDIFEGDDSSQTSFFGRFKKK